MEQKLHFIGVGGIGMSAIARIMLDQGFVISGSDMQASPLIADLEALGARIELGHAAANIPLDCQAVVYSSAIKPDNPELLEAARRGLPVYRRAEMLAYLISQKRGVGVAGAHGKTTCSAMIATMLDAQGCSPTVVIGGRLPALGNRNAQAGQGSVLVAEADESDGTFLLLHPEMVVITNIEADHLDHYHDLEHIVAAFHQYLEQVPDQGFAVVCHDCPLTRELAAESHTRCVSYALRQPADYTAENICHHALNEGVEADIYYQRNLLGRLKLQVAGEHNIANALAAIAIGRELGLSFEECANGLSFFTGTGRRFETLGQVGELRVVDDYAHHPTEIAATIAAARAQGVEKLYVVFQPHRYSRTQAMYRQFAQALTAADRVLLLELYPAFEQPIHGISSQLVATALRELGQDQVSYANTIEEAVTQLERDAADYELLLIMGAGNVRQVGEVYLAARQGAGQ